MNNTAQGIAALGRGPDSMLVHMAPQEVQSLQALAQANGTSLTTNPDTGLPEALSLSSFLPALAGAALMATGVGAPMAGMLVGGATALGTGNLQKGLMAGFGAYGGAGLAEGLAGAGTAAAAGEGVSGAMSASLGAGAQEPIASIGAQAAAPTTMASQGQLMGKGLSSLGTEAGRAALTQSMGGLGSLAKTGMMAASPVLADAMVPTATPMPAQRQGMIRPYEYTRTVKPDAFTPAPGSKERDYFDEKMVAKTPYKAIGSTFADGGDVGEGDYSIDPVELLPIPAPTTAISNFQRVRDYMASHGGERPEYENQSVGGYTYDPQTQKFGLAAIIDKPYNAPTGGVNDSSGGADQGNAGSGGFGVGDERDFAPATRAEYDAITAAGYSTPSESDFGEATPDQAAAIADAQAAAAAAGAGTGGQSAADAASDAAASADAGAANWAKGGITALAQGGANLGDYSDGGRLLRGPGDGVSDSIPAQIGNKQPARLADGEFVIPARIVSELGNGSTEAGARQLYAMMDRIQKARKKSIGKDNVAANSRAAKHLPA
jgi:hypothetical protein